MDNTTPEYTMSEFFLKCYEKMHKGAILVAYKGEVNSNIIADALELIEYKLTQEAVETPVRKKLYNVMVECLQNLYHHVDAIPDAVQDSSFGAFIISKVGNGFYLSTGNMIEANKKSILQGKIDKINSLSQEELKEFYKFVLNNQSFSDKGGGGLGLIDIAKKTGNKLNYEFIQYNDSYYFFILSVLVNGR